MSAREAAMGGAREAAMGGAREAAMGGAREAAIEVSGLWKSFGETTVLEGVDLTVAEGTVFALLGPNGAGKTTIVRILSTLIGALVVANALRLDRMRCSSAFRRRKSLILNDGSERIEPNALRLGRMRCAIVECVAPRWNALRLGSNVDK